MKPVRSCYLFSQLTKRYCSTETKTDTTSSPVVILNKIGTVATVGMNRPHKRNCVNFQTAESLLEAFEKFDNDDSVSSIVLHGIGGNFCAGYDLQELSSASGCENVLPGNRGPMGPSWKFIKKPLIASISGYAVAGGLELALLCDMRVVEDTAIMGVFCRRFGVPLIDGGTVRLPALIGLSRALDLILTGRPIKAKEAFDWGLANRVVSTGTGLGHAVELAASLKSFPQLCMQADKKSAYYATYSAKSLEDALQYEFNNGKTVLELESIYGARKFTEGVGHQGKFQQLETAHPSGNKQTNED